MLTTTTCYHEGVIVFTISPFLCTAETTSYTMFTLEKFTQDVPYTLHEMRICAKTQKIYGRKKLLLCFAMKGSAHTQQANCQICMSFREMLRKSLTWQLYIFCVICMAVLDQLYLLAMLLCWLNLFPAKPYWVNEEWVTK